MKAAATPPIPEGAPWERLDRAFRTVITVSKQDLLKAEAKEKRNKARKRRRAKRG